MAHMDEQMMARMKELLQSKEDQISFLKQQLEASNARDAEALRIIATLASRLPEVAPQQKPEQE